MIRWKKITVEVINRVRVVLLSALVEFSRIVLLARRKAWKRGYFGIFIPKEWKHARHVLSLFDAYDSKGERSAKDFAQFAARILGEEEFQTIVALRETSRRKYSDGSTDRYDWGPRTFAQEHVEIRSEYPLTDSLKTNLTYKLATAILAHKYGIPIRDAVDLMYDIFRNAIKNVRDGKTVAPGKHTREAYISAARTITKKYKLPEDHGEKIGHLIVKIGEAFEEIIPPRKDVEKHARKQMEDLIGKHNVHRNVFPHTIMKWAFGNKIDEVLSRYTPEIQKIARELEEISPFKKVKQEKHSKGGVQENMLEEKKIYAELEKRGIPRDVAEKLVDRVHLLSSREVEELVRKHVDNDPVKARAILEAFERRGKVVPVPKYWANIVSKIATGEIKENELLETLAVSKVFHTAYSKAMAKAAERDEPESTVQRMMFIKNVVNEAHRETVETLKDHPVYGEHVKRLAPAIEREMKEIAEILSKTYYAKVRGDPTLSARTFLQMELGPTVETFGPLRSHLKKVNEDFLAIGKPQEETIAKIYPEMVSRLTRLGMSPFAEKEYVGITHRHEQVRKKLKEIAG